MSLQNILVLASIAAIYAVWYWTSTRQERKKKDRAGLRAQRRILGINPGVGDGAAKPTQAASVSAFPRRCPRGVCTNSGASCPRECVEEPQVMRLIDGRIVHTCDNVEICFGPAGNIQEVKVNGRKWL